MEKKILLVDDDRKLQRLLREYLEGYGFEVMSLEVGTGVVEEIRSNQPDIVILDIMLPDGDGLELLRDIRTAYRIPVIMLTAKGEDTDRIVGLELGADDYLPKPFNPRELLARIKAVLRRSYQDQGGEAPKANGGLLAVGDLVLNRLKQTIRVKGTEIELSTTEFKILKALMEHPDTVLTRDQLMNIARGRDFEAFDRSIDVHISKLRAKVEDDPRSPKRIRTVWGSGYMFAGEP
jgi:two-component system, OmpR family, phosphate regulon response regulator OmpR